MGFIQTPPHDGRPCPLLTVPTAMPVVDFHHLVVSHAERTIKARARRFWNRTQALYPDADCNRVRICDGARGVSGRGFVAECGFATGREVVMGRSFVLRESSAVIRRCNIRTCRLFDCIFPFSAQSYISSFSAQPDTFPFSAQPDTFPVSARPIYSPSPCSLSYIAPRAHRVRLKRNGRCDARPRLRKQKAL